MLGTDQLGRDELSRIMAGARNTLLVGVVTVLIALGIGVPLGGLAALHRGAVEDVTMRCRDVLLAFPAILLAIMFAAVFNPSTVTAMAAIGIALVPVFARVVRGAGLQIMQQDYVTVARTYGGSSVWIFVRHLLPNISSVLIVQTTVAFAIAILAEAALSYLGLGTPPPTPSWGRMLSESQTFLDQAPLLALWPGVCHRRGGPRLQSAGRRPARAAGPAPRRAVLARHRDARDADPRRRGPDRARRRRASVIHGMSFSLAAGQRTG